jgi:L-ascorbate 6-phosphate lactonase
MELLRQIERGFDGGGTETTTADRQASSPEGVSLWSLGGAGFAIRTGTEVVYVDPYLSSPAPGRPFHRAISIPFSDATFVGPVSSVPKAKESGFAPSRIVTAAAGEVYDASPRVRIRIFPSRDKYEPDAVMYLIETPGGNIFHSGDTSYFEAFKPVGQENKVDVALLNFGKQMPDAKARYYMDANEVVAAARDLKARILVPMHWDMWVEAWDDPALVETALKSKGTDIAFQLLQMGDVLRL